VLEELEAKKYARRDDFRRRAESVLRALDKFLDQAATGPVKVRPGVTLEIPPDLPYLLGGQRSSDRDQDGEILADCRFLQQAMGRPVTIVTPDRAMRVRARRMAWPSARC
jgi:predicted ribonuclease YlaK